MLIQANLKMIAVATLLAALPTASATVIYVDDTAPGANNGTSWTNAYRYLQDALTVAVGGDVIRVGQGTYRPDQAVGPVVTGRAATFKLKNGVTLEGGYAGFGAPNPNTRSVALYKTILSGDLLGNDAIIDPSSWVTIKNLLTHATRQDNAYTVVDAGSSEPNAVLDGFVVTAGNSNGSENWPYTECRGGGLDVWNSNALSQASKGKPQIKACTFKLNSASQGGGGLYAYTANPTISDCNISDNYSKEYGAGMTNWGGAKPNLLSCVIINNIVDSQAECGGVYNFDSSPRIEYCSFVKNYGGFEGGAINNLYNSNPTIIGCEFIQNEATSGGAVENALGARPVFSGCTFVDNEAWYYGGAMANYYCTPLLTNCTFIANKCDDLGGAIDNQSSDPNMRNCLFNGNTAATAGGGVSCRDTDLRLINCTFTSNSAVKGRAISCESFSPPSSRSQLWIYNCILWDSGNEIYNGDTSVIQVTYSDVYGLVPGVGNIFVNPQFVSLSGSDGVAGTEDDNLRLATGSPCIDAASNSAVPVDITKDLAGKPRFKDDPATPNTGQGIPPIVDMGAYEYQTGSGPGNQQPVANAGPDQVVYAGLDGNALVTLNGSGSYDPDGDSLSYLWTWVVNSVSYQAFGVSPTIQLPLGVRTITLIVSDGLLPSSPDYVQITVLQSSIPPVIGQCSIGPNPVSRSDPSSGYVWGTIQLTGIPKSALDLTQALTLSPGGIHAFYANATESGGTSTVIAVFHKNALMAAVPANGPVMLTIVGYLQGGQTYQGTDTIQINP